MAKKWTNKILPGALHFVTANALNRRRIFARKDHCLAFLRELQNLRESGTCKLIAFVIMLDHAHFIINPLDGDVQSRTRELKSFTAKRLVELGSNEYFKVGLINRVWQESFKSIPLWSNWMIWQKINYIHANPVRANLGSASEYPWTSFRTFYLNESEPLLQVDKEWWWPDDVQKLAKALGEEQLEADRVFREKMERRG
jgi:REP element-mobilizing transposase RayT